jgi:hypothetical protein
MEVPVTGLVLHSDDSNSSSNHSHHLYLATWNDLPVSVHIHHFSGATSFDVGMITTMLEKRNLHPILTDTFL